MNIGQASYSDKVAFYKELDKMVRGAKEKSYDYTSELGRFSIKMGKKHLTYSEFETIAKSMNPLIPNKSIEFIADFIKDKAFTRINVPVVDFTRLLDKMDVNRENIYKFFKAVRAYQVKQGSTPEKIFQEFQNSATKSIAPTELDKMIKQLEIEIEGGDKELIFMTINGFEPDFKISDKQWITIANEESERDTKLKPQISNRDQNSMEQNLKEIHPILHKLKEAMVKEGIEKMKVHLEKHYEPVEGKVTIENFMAAVREIMPTITYMDVSQLSEKLGDGKTIDTEVPDTYIRESSRFHTSSNSKHK